ncbi:MAG: hypothetical protein WC519_00225 [Parcubacteria group bacterium]
MNAKKILVIIGAALVVAVAGYVVYANVVLPKIKTAAPAATDTNKREEVDLNSLDLTKVDFPVNEEADIRVRIDSNLGPILVDRAGATLYFFSEDGNLTSNCENECAAKHPPFILTEGFSIGSYIGKTAVSFFTRKDGSIQMAYKDKPLYTSSEVVPEVNDTWSIARP